jgi:hypothetical protein
MSNLQLRPKLDRHRRMRNRRTLRVGHNHTLKAQPTLSIPQPDNLPDERLQRRLRNSVHTLTERSHHPGPRLGHVLR